MRSVNIADAKAQLSSLVDAALRGEEIVIARRDVPLVRLTALESAKVQPHYGILAGKVTMRDDFETPLDDFESYR
jgi:prevent-host-death family protein